MNRNKIKYYDGNEWIDGDKKRVMRQVMRNCIIQILDIDRNDKEEKVLDYNDNHLFSYHWWLYKIF